MQNFIRDRYKFPAINWWWVELEGDPAPPPHRCPTKQCGEWFTDTEAASVEGISIFTEHSIDGLDNSIFSPLKQLSKFPRLKFLDIPADAIEHLDIASIANNLQYLRISSPRLLAVSEQGLSKQLHFLESVFPNLISLYLYFPPICYRNFDITKFPALEWLETSLDLDKQAKSILLFRNLDSMRGFGLEGLYKKDILNDISRSLIALEFWDIRTKALDLSYLAEFNSLSYLRINSKISLDGRVLADLPKLTELELWSVNRIENIEALLVNRPRSVARHSESTVDDHAASSRRHLSRGILCYHLMAHSGGKPC